MARISQGRAFLNPKAKFLRDISVAFVAARAKRNSSVLDATAGTGIRGIRYFLEGGARNLTMLDMNRSAFASAKRNAASNSTKAEVLNKSIQEFANTTDDRFDFIDVDPFGGITPYIYDVMKVAKDGTYLMLTATDTAVLCGAHAAACIRLYGSKPLHNELCHETGIRIMINYAVGVAAQLNFGVEAILSVYYAHYLRAVLRLAHGSAKASSSISNTGYVHYCNACGFWEAEKGIIPHQRACRGCGATMPTYGRMWLGQLYERKALADVAGRSSAMGMGAVEERHVETMLNEYDTPLFYSIPRMTKRMHIASVGPSGVIERLKAKGHVATRTQFDDSGIKTNADAAALIAAITGRGTRTRTPALADA
ncbi:MAG: methyltransferase [Candidatus Marsarchaeota archaeon]|jgi:tRNA (guanine26-N2/guanine27-N2)-dimethyltransferase|nr:methyltransferase [Candidatus Marsarchaeota archaeon]MCL5111958.1 methyltransferase [Candidatus Marsarchaeota archaeon]